MNELKIFNNEEFGAVRTVFENGKVLFCGSDVAKVLGYSNPSKALGDHCKGITKCDIPTNGGLQTLSFITEPDLYRLVVKSKLPSAERFEKWVFEEVLPAIRETGSYSQKPTLSPGLAAIQALVDQMAAQESRLVGIEQSVEKVSDKYDNIHNVFTESVMHRELDPKEWKKSVGSKITKIVKAKGGIQSLMYGEVTSDLYKQVETRGRARLDQRLRNRQLEMAKCGQYPKSQVRDLKKIDIIASDTKLREIADKILSEMVCANCL